MRTTVLVVLSAALTLGSLAAQTLARVQTQEPLGRPLTDITYEPTPSRIARGRYLSEAVLQCFACHSDRDWQKNGAPVDDVMKGTGAAASAHFS